MLKAVDGIHRQSFVIHEVYGLNDSSATVRSVTKKIDEVIYFAVASKFYRDILSFAVFAVNFIGGMTNKLIQKADSDLNLSL